MKSRRERVDHMMATGVHIKRVMSIIMIFICVTVIAVSETSVGVSYSSVQHLESIITELARYSQQITGMISTQTLSYGVASDKGVVLKEIYDGLSVTICNLIGLKTLLRIERIHLLSNQANIEALREIRSHVAYIDMHHDIQLDHTTRILSTIEDKQLISQVNNYIDYTRLAKKLLMDIRNDLPK